MIWSSLGHSDLIANHLMVSLYVIMILGESDIRSSFDLLETLVRLCVDWNLSSHTCLIRVPTPNIFDNRENKHGVTF